MNRFFLVLLISILSMRAVAGDVYYADSNLLTSTQGETVIGGDNGNLIHTDMASSPLQSTSPPKNGELVTIAIPTNCSSTYPAWYNRDYSEYVQLRRRILYPDSTTVPTLKICGKRITIQYDSRLSPSAAWVLKNEIDNDGNVIATPHDLSDDKKNNGLSWVSPLTAQEAFAKLSDAGGVLYLSAGTHKLDVSVKFTAPVSIIGAGRWGTAISWNPIDDEAGAPAITFGSTAAGSVLSHLELISAVPGEKRAGINIEANKVMIDHVNITEFGYDVCPRITTDPVGITDTLPVSSCTDDALDDWENNYAIRIDGAKNTRLMNMKIHHAVWGIVALNRSSGFADNVVVNRTQRGAALYIGPEASDVYTPATASDFGWKFANFWMAGKENSSINKYVSAMKYGNNQFINAFSELFKKATLDSTVVPPIWNVLFYTSGHFWTGNEPSLFSNTFALGGGRLDAAQIGTPALGWCKKPNGTNADNALGQYLIVQRTNEQGRPSVQETCPDYPSLQPLQ